MMELFTDKLSCRKGFTLIELIVVIAIIGILAAILIPQFSGFSQKAEQKRALAEARSVATAFEALVTEGDTDVTATELSNLTKMPSGSITVTTTDPVVFSYDYLDWSVTYTSGVWSGDGITT